MNENKVDLSNIIRFDKAKGSLSYKKVAKSLKCLFDNQFEIKNYYDYNNEKKYKRVILTLGDYECVHSLCDLLNIKLENFSPKEYTLPINSDYYLYPDPVNSIPDTYFKIDDFERLQRCIIEKLASRKLIQIGLDKKLNQKTVCVTEKGYFKILCQFPSFVKNYLSTKTKATKRLENLFKRKVFYKINDLAQNKVAIDKLKNGVEHLAKLKFLSMLKNTAQTVKNTQAIHKLDLVIKRNVFHKINNMRLKKNNLEQESQISIQQHDKNKEDNKPKKSLRKKLIIGSCITLILSLAILYFNLIAGIISFAIGACVLVIYGIYKSKSNKIQDSPKILLNVPIKTNTTQTLGNYIIKSQDMNHVPKVKRNALPNLLNSEI